MLEDIVDVEMPDGGDDLITRKEALKAALDWQVRPHEEVFNRIKAVIIARMQGVPKTEGWVSVNNQLPEEKGWYMVYAPGYEPGSSRGQPNHNGIMFSKWNGNAWSIEIAGGYMYRKVLVQYWMPIPIPKEEQDAEAN